MYKVLPNALAYLISLPSINRIVLPNNPGSLILAFIVPSKVNQN